MAWVDEVVTALRQLGGSATRRQILDQIARDRTDLTPHWEMTVQKTIERFSSDASGFDARRADLFFSVRGLGHGVWGLRDAVVKTPEAADLSPGEENPGRVPQTTYRILRDTALAREIKLLHRNRCQMCGLALRIDADTTYAEAHHIIPLGHPHDGPDTADNVVVLCPNHHAQCDMGAIPLSISELTSADGHSVSETSIEYHNSRIHRGRTLQ